MQLRQYQIAEKNASQNPGVNYAFLSSALAQQGPWQHKAIQVNWQWCFECLEAKINSVDWVAAREDVRRFVRPAEQPSLGLWNRELFLSELRKINA